MLIELNQFITEDNMEITSLFIQKVSVVLSSTMSHVTVSDARKAPHAKGRGKDIN